MNEKQLQFRVGLFVLGCLAVAFVLILQFSDLVRVWESTYSLAIHFEQAAGLSEGAPVEQNGISIGSVRRVVLDEEHGGVLVIVEIRDRYKLRLDSKPALVRSLFGDATVSFTPGRSEQFIPPNRRLEGEAPQDVNEIVQRLETNLGATMESFELTSAEWRRVGQNLNHLMETEQGNLDGVVERAAIALDRLTTTMESANLALTSANQLISDPEVQHGLRDTITALPELVTETRETIGAARGAIAQVEANLANLSAATDPLAEHSHTIVARLDGSLYQLEGMLTELNQLAQVVNSGEGSLQRFSTDPELYDNLNRSAAAMSVMLHNLGPIMDDMRIFSDRVARHPELLGVSGAFRGSSGIKDPSDESPSQDSGLFGSGMPGPQWFGSSESVLPAAAWEPEE